MPGDPPHRVGHRLPDFTDGGRGIEPRLRSIRDVLGRPRGGNDFVLHGVMEIRIVSQGLGSIRRIVQLQLLGLGIIGRVAHRADTDPDQLRKKLKLRGSKEYAVVITRIGSRGVALICGARQWA